MKNLIMFLALAMFSTTTWSSEPVKSEKFENWLGILYLLDTKSSKEICLVGSKPINSETKGVNLLISTHGVVIDDGSSVKLDFTIGDFANASIKIDNNKSHAANQGIVENRKRLIQELMNGNQAVVLWLKSSKVAKSTFSLNGFTEAYKTAKGWCDSWASNVRKKITTPKSTSKPESTSKSYASKSRSGPQTNAVRSAKSYLRFKGFSRSGLIQQLSSDYGAGYNVADATVAVDSLNIDWKKQAVKSAKSYLSFQGFSCKGLINQLSSSAGAGYTKSQAKYGARQAGAC